MLIGCFEVFKRHCKGVNRLFLTFDGGESRCCRVRFFLGLRNHLRGEKEEEERGRKEEGGRRIVEEGREGRRVR